VTFAKWLRERLGTRPRHAVDFNEERGKLVATKAMPTDPVASVFGILELDRSTDELVGDLRGEPHAI
jgi:hypothetical protein